MTTDNEMKINYMVVLKQLQAELDGIDARRQALEAGLAAIKGILATEANEQPDLAGLDIPSEQKRNGAPTIPPEFFAGKTPTQAYRDFKKLWGDDFTPPQIADALEAGGIQIESRTRLIQALHSVLKREREKQERQRAAAG